MAIHAWGCRGRGSGGCCRSGSSDRAGRRARGCHRRGCHRRGCRRRRRRADRWRRGRRPSGGLAGPLCENRPSTVSGGRKWLWKNRSQPQRRRSTTRPRGEEPDVNDQRVDHDVHLTMRSLPRDSRRCARPPSTAAPPPADSTEHSPVFLTSLVATQLRCRGGPAAPTSRGPKRSGRTSRPSRCCAGRCTNGWRSRRPAAARSAHASLRRRRCRSRRPGR